MEKLDNVIFYLLDAVDLVEYLDTIDGILQMPCGCTVHYTKPYNSAIDHSLYIVSIEHDFLKYENIIGEIIPEYSRLDLIDLGHIESNII